MTEIRTIAHVVPVSREILMDAGVIPDTRPRFKRTLRQRLRYARYRYVETARERLALRIAPWLRDDR